MVAPRTFCLSVVFKRLVNGDQIMVFLFISGSGNIDNRILRKILLGNSSFSQNQHENRAGRENATFRYGLTYLILSDHMLV